MDLQIFETDENYLREVYFRNLNEVLSIIEHDLRKLLDDHKIETLEKYGGRPDRKNLVRLGEHKFLWLLGTVSDKTTRVNIKIKINDYFNVTRAEVQYNQFGLDSSFNISDRNHAILEGAQTLIDKGYYMDHMVNY